MKQIKKMPIVFIFVLKEFLYDVTPSYSIVKCREEKNIVLHDGFNESRECV